MAPRVEQAYVHLAEINDPNVQAALRAVMDRINSLQGRSNDNPTFRQDVDGGANKFTNVADPHDPQDVVTKAYADAHYGATTIRTQLQAGGSAPISLTGLVGTASVIVGPHAQRILQPPTPSDSLFVESDRLLIYANVSSAWQYVGGVMGDDLFAGMFADLGPPDIGVAFFARDTGLIYVWSGNIWHERNGIIIDVIANRPTPFVGCDDGLIFVASDRNGHAWRLDYAANAWVLLKGWGLPFACTLNPNTKPSLGANDVGFRINATDFDRQYVWDGAAWNDATGQPTRGMYIDFQGAVPGTNGWVAADGALHANALSTAAAGTANVTPNNVPNFYYRG